MCFKLHYLHGIVNCYFLSHVDFLLIYNNKENVYIMTVYILGPLVSITATIQKFVLVHFSLRAFEQ